MFAPFPTVHRVLLATVLCALWAGMASPAWAKKVVYSPIVHGGEKEIEYYVDWLERPDGRQQVNHELAFEFGITERDQIAIYVVGRQEGDGLQVVRYKSEWIHQLFEQGERAIDAAIYLEYQINDGPLAADKVEFKALLEKSVSAFTVTFNGVLEKTLGENASGGTELAYAARAAWRYRPSLSPSIEAYGSLGEARNIAPVARQSHLIGPVLHFRPIHTLSLQVGVLVGLTEGTEDVRVKTQLAWEWY